jgi:hypothetical protein
MRTWPLARRGNRIAATTNPDEDRSRPGEVGKGLDIKLKTEYTRMFCIVSKSDIIEPYRIEPYSNNIVSYRINHDSSTVNYRSEADRTHL